MIEDYLIQHGGVWDESYLPYARELAYDDYTTLQEGVYVFQATPEQIKQLVLDHEAVGSNLYVPEALVYFNSEGGVLSGKSFYNYEPYRGTNHSVTIVGWDDAYAASNFTHTTDTLGAPLTYTDETGSTNALSEDEARAITTPEGDGAWIVQNSWGNSVHEQGFFYMSYYSAERDNMYAAALDMQPSDTYEYNFQYDGTADYSSVYDDGNEAFCTDAGTQAANVFVNTTNEPVTVEAIGVTSIADEVKDFDVSLYTGLTDPNCPTSGILASTAKGRTEHWNYKTIVLDNPVTVGPGERYSVVLSFATSFALGVELSYGTGAYAVEAQTDPGQSFFLAAKSDEWKDLNDYGACYRIKALGNGFDPTTTSLTVRFENGLGTLLCIA